MGKIPQHTTSAPFFLSLFLFVFWASSCNFYWEETTYFGQEWTALILVQLKRKKKKDARIYLLPDKEYALKIYAFHKHSDQYFNIYLSRLEEFRKLIFIIKVWYDFGAYVLWNDCWW